MSSIVNDTQNRMRYLAETVDALFPGVDGTGSPGPLTVVPSVRSPRLLVPVHPRRAAASAVRRYTAQQGTRERLAAAALAAAIRVGLCERMPRVTSAASSGESIWTYLSAVLGRPVVTALALTSQRPNRKPVLQVFDDAGHTVGFAKVGVSTLAARLIAKEASALAALASAGLQHVEVPRVLHYGSWQELPVLVTAALPRRRAPRPNSDIVLRAMREVSQNPVGNMGDVAEYLTELETRGAVNAGPVGDQWREVFRGLTTGRDVTGLRMGAWHGDFTEWNCARNGTRLAVWDWERYTGPAPVGFDRLHYVLNHEVHGRRDRFAAAAARIVADSGTLLASWRMSADDARTTALLYLLDIALRYVTDDLGATDAGGRIENWALPVVRASLTNSVSECLS